MPKRDKSSLLKTVAGSSGLRIANIGLSLVVSILLTRILGVEEYGIYAYSMSWVFILNIISTLGCQNLIIREVAASRSNQKWGLIRGLLQWSNLVVLINSVAVAGLSALLFWVFQGRANSITFNTLCIALALVPITAMTALRQAALKGFRHIIQGQMADAVLQPSLFILLLVTFYFSQLVRLDATWIMTLKVLSSILTFVVGAWILYKVIPDSVKKAEPQYDVQKWIPSMLAMLFTIGAGVLYNRFDTLMLGIMKGPAAVGLYAVALRLSNFILFSQQVGASILGPYVADLYNSEDIESLQRIANRSARAIMAYALPITLILTIFGSLILSIFGPEFSKGWVLLVILCIGKLINVSTGAVVLLLNMTHHEKDNAVVIGVCALLNVLFNLILIPQAGAEGAAIATTMSTIISNIWLAIIVYKRLKINCTVFGSLRFDFRKS